MQENEVKTPGAALASAVDLAIHKRRSTRHFTDQSLAKTDIDTLLSAGIAAPSGGNTQNQRFLVLTDREEIAALDHVRFVWPYKSYTRKVSSEEKSGIIAGSQAVIIVFADTSLTDVQESGEYYVWHSLNTQNACAAIENILIMATAMGIGSCWVSASEEMRYTRMLERQAWRDALPSYAIPLHYQVQGIILLGYPKKLDEAEFPAGEGMHGGVWSSTERGPIESYLVKAAPAEKLPEFSGIRKIQRRLLSTLIRFSVRLAARADRVLHRMERPFVASQDKD